MKIWRHLDTFIVRYFTLNMNFRWLHVLTDFFSRITLDSHCIRTKQMFFKEVKIVASSTL